MKKRMQSHSSPSITGRCRSEGSNLSSLIESEAGSKSTPIEYRTMDAPASFSKFELRPPSHQNAVDIFDGKWASNFAEVCPELRAGQTPLFTVDRRPGDAARLLGINGRLDGMRVLELGPLE